MSVGRGGVGECVGEGMGRCVGECVGEVEEWDRRGHWCKQEIGFSSEWGRCFLFL